MVAGVADTVDSIVVAFAIAAVATVAAVELLPHGADAAQPLVAQPDDGDAPLPVAAFAMPPVVRHIGAAARLPVVRQLGVGAPARPFCACVLPPSFDDFALPRRGAWQLLSVYPLVLMLTVDDELCWRKELRMDDQNMYHAFEPLRLLFLAAVVPYQQY